MTKNQKLFPIKIALFVFLLALLYVSKTIHFIDDQIYSSLFDDAMISLKYAQSIANGNGEGFTNPLWTYFFSFIYRLSGKNINIVPLIIQIICSILVSLNCYYFSRKALIINNLSKPTNKNNINVQKLLIILISLYPVIY